MNPVRIIVPLHELPSPALNAQLSEDRSTVHVSRSMEAKVPFYIRKEMNIT
ncbi:MULTISPECIES: hypothetical protein [unclassified Paenibacillus]|uniref:Uncharacterized protein n=1 Tax=Paenibacillus provencensis TaxID=441151 RepID=A0ABW3Q0A1_9BACL|nr:MULTISPECIES: hypothetical protein [unclassified Paenibacillus]MCM3128452.1 hypothetical protein [Paenibacillus sp. MER 78]SFS78992.1 hypothetical protein SAMN04488601_103281 [Paenibacillus sp. 453mf]